MLASCQREPASSRAKGLTFDWRRRQDPPTMAELLLAVGIGVVLGLLLALSDRWARLSHELSSTSPTEEAPALRDTSCSEEAEPTVDIPVSVLNQVVEQLARLEVLERRNQMRIVRRQERGRAIANRHESH